MALANKVTTTSFLSVIDSTNRVQTTQHISLLATQSHRCRPATETTMASKGHPRYYACGSDSLASSDASPSGTLTSSSSVDEVVGGGSIGLGTTLSGQAETRNSDLVQDVQTTDEPTHDEVTDYKSTNKETTPASGSEVRRDVNEDRTDRAINHYSLLSTSSDPNDKATGITMSPCNPPQTRQGLPLMSQEKRASLQRWASGVCQASEVDWANSAINPCNLLESRLLPAYKPKRNYCPVRARLEGWLSHQYKLDRDLAREMHTIDWRCVPQNIWVAQDDLREDLIRHPDLLERSVNHNVDHVNVLLAAEQHLMALRGTGPIRHRRWGRRIDLEYDEQLKLVRCFKEEVLPLIGSVFYTQQVLRMLKWKQTQLETEPHTFYTTTLTNIPLRMRRAIANQPELLCTALKLLVSEYEVFPERFQDGDLRAIIQPLSTPLCIQAQRLWYSMSCGGFPEDAESHDVEDPLARLLETTKPSSLKPLEQIVHLLTPKGSLTFPPPIGTDPIVMMVLPGGPPPNPSDTPNEDAAQLDAEVLGSGTFLEAVPSSHTALLT